ncbi:hypothetical protein C361_04736 [Cryptococcus neoformans Tu259-1]|uniref:Transcription initiation factor TFIID subunit 12 domain-containing protein n=1 Tax=Cryptococcus neoformans Tu259-1 TaxID=1230072 RepID=A0A854QAH4_CRYNE|nr:hypothetical protein C353_04429 [Cryptococcus neoformans var. grubii AD1-83a]OWZ53035.1 hypothetical protein C368_04602 [Cryptococcus neoformans var. grubii 125.91]OXG17743.1 hypothetical protein C361_04736 [Cryptococcus neoformans var. grubii Tu259-1]OXG55754.1 hypothetical protein C354_04363 [Cryptococcus neoformans var. grubii MW-RSA1955]OXG59661.1 hypothetical protein C352_04374 [Cryptococcus neoformans var. grubii CHC193]OXG61400.1 hypothetical protein C351_04314 [Cryptococcus neoforma
MSRPPSAAGSAPGTPTPRTAASGGTTPIHTIVQNLPNLFQMYEKGTLSDTQVTQLRTLMHTHIRQITANALSSGRSNPLYSLPDAINPSLPWKTQPALVSPEQFDLMIKTVTKQLIEAATAAAAKRAREKAAADVTSAAAGGSSAGAGVGVGTAGEGQVQGQGAGQGSQMGTPIGAGAGVGGAGISRPGTPMSATSSGTSLRASQPSPAPQVQGTTVSTPPTVGSTGTTTGPTTTSVIPGMAAATPPRPRPHPPGIYSHTELTQLAKLNAETRNAWLAKDPQRQQQFSASLAYWRSQPKSNFQPQNRPPPNTHPAGRPPPSNANAPGSSSNPISVTTPNPSATTSFATALPDARSFALRPPPNQNQNQIQTQSARPPAPPAPPPEPEPLRRKRVLHAMLGEIAPGLAMEMGMDDALSEVMNKLLEQGFEGAMRLAKHRGADKVELKDMARYIDHAWDMVVPGFDAAPSHHVHVAPERERKKGRTVVPRAAAKSVVRKDDE